MTSNIKGNIKLIQAVSLFTPDLEASVDFYKNTFGANELFRSKQTDGSNMVGLSFAEGKTEFVLHDSENLKEPDIEVLVEDVREFYNTHKYNENIDWIQTPIEKPFGGHLAVMRTIADDIVLIIVGS
ncbi:VOC family protein [Aquisalibacillus elongatus]|uniref:Glyoxalase/bleomycin resistance protein/dioxygenase superfamily protein n=1 Tax=Aquisalibacillus elongatus TaxID=485577 RepID=A0A3N5B0C6_9BACI|nr:VOC family protein [Aquisalibacillus elongatus]RPF50707.1 glyoxalase/bleomycin resistance protein/dioxygenase superfamily protein [Aquisalibacillus elongatus]